MQIPNAVLQLIQEEQLRQQGAFVPANQKYIEKIATNAELLVHQFPNENLGFAFFYCNDTTRLICYITLLAVSPELRGKKIGKCMIEYIMNLARSRGFMKCQLEVGLSNVSAQLFYKSLGFQLIEKRAEKILLSIEL